MEGLTKVEDEDNNIYAWGLGQDEKECVKALHNYLGIGSRKELTKNYKKVEAFKDLVKQFEGWMKCH